MLSKETFDPRGRYVRCSTYEQAVNNDIISYYCLLLSAVLILSAIPAAIMTGEGFKEVCDGFLRIILSPANLVPDYFEIGGLSATLLNVGLCGLSCSLLIFLNHTPAGSSVLAGYFLVIAHAFFGLNLLNMWPCFLGVVLYCKVRRLHLGDNLHNAMFATALGPFISEFLFRFPYNESEISLEGFVFSLILSILFGFTVPALMPGTARMHRGFSLYKAGLAIGLFGFFMYALLFKTIGVDGGERITYHNVVYESFGRSYGVFINIVWGGIFLATAIVGICLCKGFGNYRELLKSSGHNVDFCEKFGMKVCLINLGIYGLMMLSYYNIVIFFTDGVGFTGPTAGVIFAAVTFAACGQHPKNVLPVIGGYVVLSLAVNIFCALGGLEVKWSLSTQSYINGLAFATGLCPFAGKYGTKIGIFAGMISATICTSTAAMHCGYMLYNSGFTAGLSALLLVPILDFYNAKPIRE